MSAAQSEALGKKKSRNRTRLSCIQCHTRKQRCNRTLPCSNCMSRGAEDECTYEAPKTTKRAKAVSAKQFELPSVAKSCRGPESNSEASPLSSGSHLSFSRRRFQDLRRASSWSDSITDRSSFPFELTIKFYDSLSSSTRGSAASTLSDLDSAYDEFMEDEWEAARSKKSSTVVGISGGRVDPFSSLPDLGMRIDEKLLHCELSCTRAMSLVTDVHYKSPQSRDPVLELLEWCGERQSFQQVLDASDSHICCASERLCLCGGHQSGWSTAGPISALHTGHQITDDSACEPQPGKPQSRGFR